MRKLLVLGFICFLGGLAVFVFSDGEDQGFQLGTWGGGPFRQGQFSQSLPSHASLRENSVDVFKGALKTQALLLKSGAHEEIFFGTDSGKLRWVDGYDFKLNTELEVSDFFLSGTPVTTESEKIWGLFVNTSSEGAGNRHYKILEISDRKVTCELPFNIDDWIKPLAETDTRASSTLHCVTALAYEPVSRKLVFGCSRNPRAEANIYASSKGTTGGLFTVDLPKDRCPGPNDIKMFRTAEVDQSPDSGVDVGIWMAGAAVAIVGDGSVLFPTGNGLFDQSKNNLGCSLVHLDLTTEPYRIKAVRAHDDRGSRECVGLNVDYASGGVALARGTHDKIWYFLGGKDGVLKYGPLDGMADRNTHYRLKFSQKNGYGTPQVRSHLDGSFSVFTSTQVWAWDEGRDEVVVEAPASDKTQCLGVAKVESGQKQLREYWAGSHREDHLLVAEDSPAEFELTHIQSRLAQAEPRDRYPEGSFAPYGNFRKIGFEPTSADLKKFPPGAMLTAYYVSKGFSGWDLRLDSNPVVAQEKVRSRIEALRLITNVNCEKLPDGYKAIFLKSVQVYPKTENQVDVRAFKINPDGQARQLWKWGQVKGPWILPNTSSALIQDTSGEGRLVVTLWNPEARLSKLSILDASTGRLLSETPYEGRSHFTQPFASHDKLWVTTKEPFLLHNWSWTEVGPKDLLQKNPNNKDDYSLSGLRPDNRLLKKSFAKDKRCLFRKLDPQEVAVLLAGQSMSVVDPVAKECADYPSVILYDESPQFSYESLRALGERRSGQIWVGQTLLAKQLIEAPLCEACDEVWLTPRRFDPKEFSSVVVIDDENLDSRHSAKSFKDLLPGEFDLLAETFPFDAKSWAAGERFSGKVLLTRSSPRSKRARSIAAEIKRRGASEVVWDWPGFEAGAGETLRLQSLPGVEEINYQEFLALKTGRNVFVDLRKPTKDPHLPFPGIYYFTEIDLDGTDFAKDAQLVVYGASEFERSAYEWIQVLQSRGFKKIKWYRGGIRDYRERSSVLGLDEL